MFCYCIQESRDRIIIMTCLLLLSGRVPFATHPPFFKVRAGGSKRFQGSRSKLATRDLGTRKDWYEALVAITGTVAYARRVR